MHNHDLEPIGCGCFIGLIVFSILFMTILFFVIIITGIVYQPWSGFIY